MPVPYKLNYFEIETGIDSTSTFIHTGDFTATKVKKYLATSNDILLGDGTTVSLSSLTTLTAFSATSPLLYNNTTGVFSIPVATAIANGYLSSTDWINFDGKQNTITLTTSGSNGSSTFISNTLNVPTYTLSGLGGVPTTRTLTINGTTQDLSADRTFSVGTVTSVGLSMPAAFSVASSPVTGSGTIAVTGAGLASQYIRGDGQLADFPTSGGGGGSSVSYYLNGSVNQGTFVGNVYREMNKTPIFGAGTDFTINANGYISQFITDANDPNSLLIPAGNWNFETFFSASSVGGSPTFYIELYKYNGTAFTLIASNSATPELIAFGTTIAPYFSSLAVPETVLLATDRLAIRIYVTHSGKTITLHTENSHLCQVITTFTTGLQSLNGLTKQTQYFAVGTSGTDFAISSSVDTHTFNLPDASTTARGVMTTGTQTFAGLKTFNTTSASAGLNLNKTTNDVGLFNFQVAGVDKSYIEWNINDAGSGLGTAFNIRNGQGAIGLYDSTNTGLKISGGNTNIAGQLTLGSTITNGTYTYTLPSATGTLALVGGSGVGTVTSVAALTLGTSGSDLSSSVANGTTTPVITLNVPDASATARGVVTTGTQTISGEKTLINRLSVNVTNDICLYAKGTGAGAHGVVGEGTAGYGGWFLNTGTSNEVLRVESISLTGALATFNNTNGLVASISNSGNITGNSFIKTGGTSSQFLKADGSVDSTTYQGAITLAAIGASPNANAATLSSGTLTLQPASASFGGVMTTGTQTISGLKTFENSGITANFNRTVLGGAIVGFQILGVDKSFIEWNVNDAGSGAGTAMNLRNNQGAIGLYDSTNTGLKIASGSGVFAGSSTATAFIPTGSTIPTNGMYLSVANTLNFATNTTNRLSISSTGNTGIGIASATERLHLANSTNGFVGLRLEGTGDYAGSDWIMYASSVSAPSADDFLGFFNNSATDGATTGYKFTLNKTGVATLINLAGTGSRAVLADANGALSAPVSDISVKQNINPIGYGLNEIVKMNPVWFDFVNDYKNYGQGRQNGNIAQEMANIIPEAVFTTPSTGKMGINYDQLHAVYIKAIQELKAEIDILKNK